jgi:hypothetical protein
MVVRVANDDTGRMLVSVRGAALAEPPVILWSHIDGPLLSWATHLHWLTWWERICVFFGGESAESLAQKRWPQRKEWVGPNTPNPDLWYEIKCSSRS